MAVMPDTGDLGSVKQWAHLIKLESKAILDVVEGVSARLQHFRTLLWIDEGDINREIKYLNHQSKVIGQGLLLGDFPYRCLIHNFQERTVI